MKNFLLILLILFSFNALYSQDVIYTINGKIDNQNTSLDSILVENLTNNTRLLFKNLPDLPDYNINLTKQAFWGATGIHNLKESSAFSTYINTPGLLSLACNINDFSSLNIFVYNMQGQRVYAASNVRLNRNSLINFHFGSPGLYLVEIKSDLGIQTFKGAGLKKEGTSAVTMSIQNATPLSNGFKDTKQTSTSDFSFKLGDSLRFSVYKNQYYASPITIKVSGSGTISFVLKHDTLLTGTFTDSRDGQTYKTVKIGNQEWMAENLKYMPSVSPPSQGSKDSAYYYVYGYRGDSVSEAKDTTNYKTYGVLYNWTAAKNACPSGWHLPSDDEWKILEMYLGMSQSAADSSDVHGTDEGKKLKSTSGWQNDGNGTDAVGFSALPGGYCDGGGDFGDLGNGGYWWSATVCLPRHAWYRYLSSGFSGVGHNANGKATGYSVRCVRDSDHAPVANFTASTTSGKVPLTVTFTDHSSNTPVFWHWDFGDGYTSTLQNPTHTYVYAGTYRVTLTVTNSYGSGAIKTDSIVVGDIPIARFTASPTGGTAPLTVTFTNHSLHTPTSWHWDFGDGDSSTLRNPTHTYTQVGVYTVTLTATNKYGTDTKTEKCIVYSTGTFTDSRDGQTYKTVKIGNQEWMAENLKYLPSVNPPSDSSSVNPYYYVYGYQGDSVSEAKDSTNYKTYGVLYNWTAAKNACPSGWHLPSDDEWKTLEMNLGMSQRDADDDGIFRGTDEGKKLKSTSGWDYGNGTNAVGFSALPGGCRSNRVYFYDLGNGGYWWSVTASDSLNAWCRCLDSGFSEISRYSDHKASGFSVRCVRDQ
ncbi:PKD domain-containing protein [Candidatus Sulfidibacterium hydrothermale]|uniref:FISUMP domain-containing protein n=1 Tax=Candidatus Sulfidibacterium hydrothermale TaxID=2875962 RepID=UPI001F0AAAA7|nr:FISUMP domain-containing protein [Candidatus Sulfidibacterium hydrothermale]UBM63513.1 PKD domain-containing protein [Candidatus Sulfidibacterium hydrothermale]